MAADKKSFQWNKETIIIMGLMCVVFFWTLNRIQPEPGPQEEKIEQPKNEATRVVDKAMVPLATGKEPIDKIFVQSGCAACHMIPGIRVAKGREGPKLELGTNARRRWPIRTITGKPKPSGNTCRNPSSIRAPILSRGIPTASCRGGTAKNSPPAPWTRSSPIS